MPRIDIFFCILNGYWISFSLINQTRNLKETESGNANFGSSFVPHSRFWEMPAHSTDGGLLAVFFNRLSGWENWIWFKWVRLNFHESARDVCGEQSAEMISQLSRPVNCYLARDFSSTNFDLMAFVVEPQRVSLFVDFWTFLRDDIASAARLKSNEIGLIYRRTKNYCAKCFPQFFT